MCDLQRVIPRTRASEFETAAQQWSAIGAPYETALARMGLGHALRTEGQEARARLEFQTAGVMFERIGAATEVARAAAALDHASQGQPRAPARAAPISADPWRAPASRG